MTLHRLAITARFGNEAGRLLSDRKTYRCIGRTALRTGISGFCFALALALGMAGQARAAPPQIKLGAAGPFSGPNAAFGMQLKNGASQAVADINATGGILGRTISIAIGDDVSDPREAVSVANKFANFGVSFVVGHFNSGTTIPASDVYRESNILVISPASTSPKVTDRGLWNMFRTCGRDDQQGAVAAAYILKNFRGKRIAIVNDKTTYGQGLAEEVRKALRAGSMNETLYEAISVGTKDFGSLLLKLKAANIDLLYYGGTHVEAALILRQMRGQGVDAVLMAADGITDDDFAAIAGPAAEGTLMTYAPDPRKRPEAATVLAEFRARKFEPQAYTLYSYAAVEVIKQAAESAKSLDPRKLSALMHAGHAFRTVIGTIRFDNKGDVSSPAYVMYRWKKNQSGKITYTEIE